MTDNEQVAGWVSRYALTSGIERVVGVRREYGGRQYISTPHSGNRLGQLHLIGADVHLDFADAIADAEQRRIRRIASLRKQIEKLEALTFELRP